MTNAVVNQLFNGLVFFMALSFSMGLIFRKFDLVSHQTNQFEIPFGCI